jgi:hypothetical protein
VANRTAQPPTRPPRDTRPPVVIGYLTPGTGVTARAAYTTVANKELPRRPAPTVDATRAEIAAQVPAALYLTPQAASPVGQTVATHRAPRTVLAGASRALGVGARTVAGHLGAGEVIVLNLPDASVDLVKQRPSLGVAGHARVIVMRGDGEVLADGVATGRVPMPRGTALVAVQADPVTGDGLAGWHVRSRICALGTHTAMGFGCVLTVVGIPTTPAAAVWVTAGDLVAETSQTLTRFAGPVHAVAIAVESAGTERPTNVDMQLVGATAPHPPTVVLTGSQAVLVYEVEPEPEKAVSVRVEAGGDWRITAILAGDLPAAALRDEIVRRGVTGVTGRIAGSGKGCDLSWWEGDEDGRR